jgi:hypothetical protein
MSNPFWVVEGGQLTYPIYARHEILCGVPQFTYDISLAARFPNRHCAYVWRDELMLDEEHWDAREHIITESK